MTAWDVGCFFTFPEETQDEEVTLSDFYDLFGCSGVSITYPDHDSNRTVHDYYTLSDSGDPMRLARVYGTAAAVDLDGDGTEELVASEQSDAQLIFQRDGALYEVDPGPAGCFPPGPDMQYQSFRLLGHRQPLPPHGGPGAPERTVRHHRHRPALDLL